MAKKQPFALIYQPSFERHLEYVESKYLPLVRDKIEEQLRFESDVPSRNRKPLAPPGILGASWEIRFGPNNRFRVFYEIDQKNREVHILAIGVKSGSKLLIEGEELES